MKLKTIIRCICFLVTAGVLLSLTADFLQVNNARDTVGLYGFYKEPDNSIDVALFGPSQIYTGFYPPLAYAQHGFTSFGLSTAAMPSSLYLPALKEMRSRQNPQLYVFEIWGFFYKQKDQYKQEALRRFIDNMPSSENKTETIQNLIPQEDQLYFRFPFLKYHGSWERAGTCWRVMQQKQSINRRGYSVMKNFSSTPSKNTSKCKSLSVKISPEGMEHLKALLEYCKAEQLSQVLFTAFPVINMDLSDDSLKEAFALIRSYGYDFLDMNTKVSEIGLDQKRDFYNQSHLNVYGAEKMTDYFGGYIAEHYDIVREHTKAVTEEWQNCAAYNDDIFAQLKKYVDSEKKKDQYQRYCEDDLMTAVHS